ncbi:MAG TPA: AsmA-like C-terminal region-containing protein [Steroidobacteraceae bacterium]|nr:AsmA-like C-terminal region-containing protein [Steroidobacteraceae bacterium]
MDAASKGMQGRYSAWTRRFVIAGAVLLGLVVALLALSQYSFALRDPASIEKRLSKLLGFEVSINGPLTVRLSLRPRVNLNDVHLRRPNVAAQDAFSAKAMTVQVDLLPFLHHQWSIRRLQIEDAEMCVSVQRDSSCDWRPALDAIDELTRLDEITIRRLRLMCHGGLCGKALKQDVALVIASAPAQGRSEISVYAKDDDSPFLILSGDGWATFRANRPWDVKASLRRSLVRAQVQGTIGKPRELRDVELQVDAHAQPGRWHGVALDELHIRGSLKDEEGGYRFRIVRGEWGSGRVTGEALASQTDSGLQIHGTGAAQGLDLERWLNASTRGLATAGYIDASSTFETRGATLEEWLEHLQGDARVDAGRAEFPIDQVERWSKGFLKFAFSLPAEGELTHIRCMGGNFRLRAGRAETRNLRIDTETTRMRGAGSVNLPSGEMDFLVKPTLKRGLIKDAPLIQVSGRIEEPVTRLATDEAKTAFKPVLDTLSDQPTDPGQPCG